LKAILLAFSFLFSGSIVDAQNWNWARQNGSTSIDGASGFTVDNDGNCYFAGSFSGPYCYFTNDTSAYCQGDNDLYIIKYDRSGNELWFKQFGSSFSGGSCSEGPGRLVVDSFKNIYLVGAFCGNINLGTNHLTGFGKEIFLAKFDSVGGCIWAVSAGGFGSDAGGGIIQDDQGNIYICGYNSQQAIFGNDTIPAGGFIAKYDSSGNVIWAKNKFRYSNNNASSEILPSDLKIFNSHILFSGNARNDTIVVDSITVLVPQIILSSTLASFDTSGNVEWIRIFGGNQSGTGFNFSVDNSGNAYVTGGFVGTGYFGNDTLTTTSQFDFSLTKIDINGSIQWTHQANSSVLCSGTATSTSPGDGSIYVTGYFKGDATFGNHNISASTGQDMFLARYDSNGTCLGVLHCGPAQGVFVAQNSNGNPFVCGLFQGTLHIGSDSLTYHGQDDIFVAKCDVFIGIDTVVTLSRGNQLVIYPNPVKGKCDVAIPDEFLREQKLLVSIYDYTGRLIQQKSLLIFERQIKLNLEDEARGIYNVTLSDGKNNYSGKIVNE